MKQSGRPQAGGEGSGVLAPNRTQPPETHVALSECLLCFDFSSIFWERRVEGMSQVPLHASVK